MAEISFKDKNESIKVFVIMIGRSLNSSTTYPVL
jgi:hypothetical protein